MFGRSKLVTEITVEANQFTSVAKLPVIPSVTLAEYFYGRKGTPSALNGNSLMSSLEEGRFGNVVGIWMRTPRSCSYSEFMILSKQGDLYDATTWPQQGELKADIKYNNGKSLEGYILAVGPNVPLKEIVEKYI